MANLRELEFFATALLLFFLPSPHHVMISDKVSVDASGIHSISQVLHDWAGDSSINIQYGENLGSVGEFEMFVI